MLVATVVLVRLYWSPCRDNGPGGPRLVLRRFRLASGCSRTSETMILQCGGLFGCEGLPRFESEALQTDRDTLDELARLSCDP